MKTSCSILWVTLLLLSIGCKKEKLDTDRIEKRYTMRVIEMGTGLPMPNVQIGGSRIVVYIDQSNWYIPDISYESLFSLETDANGFAAFNCLATDFLQLKKTGYLDIQVGPSQLDTPLIMVPQGIIQLTIRNKGIYSGTDNFKAKVWSEAKLNLLDSRPGTEDDPSYVELFNTLYSFEPQIAFLRCAANIPNSLKISFIANSKMEEFRFDNILVARNDTAKFQFDY